MIVEWLITALVATLNFFATLRPNWNPEVPPEVGTFIGIMKGMNEWLPVNETVTMVSIVVVGVSAMLVWKYSEKIITLIRG